ncbi:MAG: hypothetical protein RIM80_01410 [Alphaproteobacteria bacterium]
MTDGPLAHLTYYETTLTRPRYREPKRIVRHGAKVYSQNDEDGILQEIFRRIGVANRGFAEFGVQDGGECNTVLLLTSGWSGLWLEAEAAYHPLIRDRFRPFIEIGQLEAREATVTAENVDDLLGGLDPDLDLLSIDIDYNDYWVWRALTAIRPRVVTIEYNASLKPPLSLAAPYAADAAWDGGNFYGASLKALEKLGREKGYRLVGCCFSGVNAFFVRDDVAGDRFQPPFTAENHYEPPRYFMRYLQGHRPGYGRYVQV